MIVRIGPNTFEIEYEGKTLAQMMREVGISLDLPCNGRGTCGKCKVRVSGQLSDLTDTEKRHLSSSEIGQGIRLACQAVPTGDCVVSAYSSAGSAAGNILVEGTPMQQQVVSQPLVKKDVVSPPAPAMDDQRYHLDRILDSLAELRPSVDRRKANVSLGTLQSLPDTLSKSDWQLTVAHTGDCVIAVEPGDTTGEYYGAAFDIGTTTVVGYLVDLSSGSQVAVASRTNPQVAHGADLISRITYSSQSVESREALRSEIVSALNDILNELASKAGVAANRIYHCTVAGNTCMTHMLLGLDTSSLATMPYVGVMGRAYHDRASQLGLNVHPDGLITVLPNIGGFIGSDTVAAAIAAGLDGRSGTSLLLDLGTNGELVLVHDREMFACSTAAGPAFEGAQIVHGMRGSAGAIEAVAISPKGLSLRVINGGEPMGICGSGLVDAVAELLRVGIIDFTGRLCPPLELAGRVDPALASRVKEDERGVRFVLFSNSEREISLFQSDVRQLQLAKGAIAAGFSILCKRAGISCSEIDTVFLAGAFGNYINKTAAVRIGMLPGIDEERIVPLGNAAGTGAKMALLSEELLDRADRLAASAIYIELGNDPTFQDEFMNAMMFMEGAAG